MAIPICSQVRLAKAGGNDMRGTRLALPERKSFRWNTSSTVSAARLDEVIPPDVMMAGLIDMLDRQRLRKLPINPRLTGLAEMVRRKISKDQDFSSRPGTWCQIEQQPWGDVAIPLADGNLVAGALFAKNMNAFDACTHE
jgi:hypothetical protein